MRNKLKEKDRTEKLFIVENEVFCDIFNAICFDGRKVIKEKEIVDAPVAGAFKYEGKVRGIDSDVSKYYRNANLNIALLTIENQSTLDSRMPLRVIGYEGARYNVQYLNRAKYIYPVITIILNFNTHDRWSAPKSLKECFKNNYPVELDEYINDYKIHVVDVAFLEENEINKFNSDFRMIADYYYQKRNKGNYDEYSKQVLKYPHQAFCMLSVLTGDNSFEIAYNDYEETHKDDKEVTMEKILDTLMNKGRLEGEARGEARGRFETLTKNLKTLISKNHTFEESCELLDVDEETKEKLLETGEFSVDSFKQAFN